LLNPPHLQKIKYTINKENNKNLLYTVNKIVYIRTDYCLSRPLNSPSYKNESGYTKHETKVYQLLMTVSPGVEELPPPTNLNNQKSTVHILMTFFTPSWMN